MNEIDENIENWEDLPIIVQDTESIYNGGSDGWFRNIERETTISELLTIWDIENGSCEMVQVLRHLRNYFNASKDSK